MYGFRSAIHSRRSSHTRFFSNHQSTLKYLCSEMTSMRIGMKPGDMRMYDELPLLLLARTIFDSRSSITWNRHSVGVISGIFDPYQSCSVAQDHLLSGVPKDFFLPSFMSLTREGRFKANKLFVDVLLRNGLMAQGFKFNNSKEKLHLMYTTATFRFSPFLPPYYAYAAHLHQKLFWHLLILCLILYNFFLVTEPHPSWIDGTPNGWWHWKLRVQIGLVRKG